MVRILVRRRGSRCSAPHSRFNRHRKRVFIVSVAGLPLILAVQPGNLAAQARMRIENATPVAIVIAVLHSVPTAAAPPNPGAGATLPKTEDLSNQHTAVNPASAAASTDIFEMGSLAATIGQIGFIPIGMQPADTAALVEGRSIQSMKPTLCQVRVLDAVNHRFPSANLTTANILPVNTLDPRFSVSNVNIQGTPTQLARVNKGRYLPRRRMFFGLLIGYGPSLHIVSHPSFLDPHALVFSPTAFTAHLDSAWADTPVGLFLHFVLDVLRPKARNPCP
jgi:hypothetical protein